VGTRVIFIFLFRTRRNPKKNIINHTKHPINTYLRKHKYTLNKKVIIILFMASAVLQKTALETQKNRHIAGLLKTILKRR
jgi:hypothetical protein